MEGVCFESPELEALPFEDLGVLASPTESEPQTPQPRQLVSGVFTLSRDYEVKPIVMKSS